LLDEEVPLQRCSALLAEPDEPQSYKQLMMSENAEHWKEAMKEEYNSLMKNQTWILAKLPPGRIALNHKWIGKYKPEYPGVEERWKATLTVVGTRQQYKINFNETFAPVPKQSAIKIFLSYAAAMDLELTQFDIKTAFLYAKLKETSEHYEPEGFVVEGKEDHVCQLLKSLYGLKQAPFEWNEEFNEFILAFGLVRSEADPCIYFRCAGGVTTFIILC
jgi:hypothetical protein